MNDTVSSNGISSNIYSLFCRDSFFFFLQLCSTCDIKRIITGHAFLLEPPPMLLYTSVFLSKSFRITAYAHPFFSFCDFFFSFFHCSIFEIDEIEIVIVTLLLISNKQLSIINRFEWRIMWTYKENSSSEKKRRRRSQNIRIFSTPHHS